MKRRDFTLAALASPLVLGSAAAAIEPSANANLSAPRGTMAIQTAYTQALSSQSAVGQNRYAVKLKNLTAGGSWARIKLKASAGGPCLWQSVYVGKYSGGNFDFSTPSAVTFGGSSSVLLAASEERWSDPFPLATAAGNSLVARFDINGSGGQYYSYQAVSETETLAGWSSGLIGAANGNLSAAAYTVYVGNGGHYAHSVTAVEVADALEDFGVTDPAPEETTAAANPWFDAIKADQLYSNGNFFPGVAGQLLVVGLYNPAGSGRDVYLQQIDINPDADTRATVHSSAFDATWPINGSRCNLDFRNGAPASIAKIHSPSLLTPAAGLASVPAGLHGFRKFRGNVDSPWNRGPFPCPIVRIAPGYGGLALVLHTPGMGAAVNFHWQEIPIVTA